MRVEHYPLLRPAVADATNADSCMKDKPSKRKLKKEVVTCHYTATGTHVPHRITQCYVPPDRGDIPAFTPAEAVTPEGCKAELT